MRVTILGARGNVVPSARGYARHAGVLVGSGILLDLGEPAYLKHRPRHLFITHLHPDHLAPLAPGALSGVHTYVPEPARELPEARVLSSPARVGRYRIVPVPTVHSAKLRSQGYVVESARRRVFYSGDMVAIEPRYHRRLGRLDLVITDGSYLRRGGLVRTDATTGERFGHAGIPDLVEFFRGRARRIVITHFGSWFYRDIPGAIRRIESLGDGVPVRAAHDGFVIDV